MEMDSEILIVLWAAIFDAKLIFYCLMKKATEIDKTPCKINYMLLLKLILRRFLATFYFTIYAETLTVSSHRDLDCVEYHSKTAHNSNLKILS